MNEKKKGEKTEQEIGEKTNELKKREEWSKQWRKKTSKKRIKNRINKTEKE